VLRIGRAKQDVESKMQRWASRGVAAEDSEAATKPAQFSLLQRRPEPCVGTVLRLAVNRTRTSRDQSIAELMGARSFGRTSGWNHARVQFLL
jgi:hypothetical protein